MLYKINNFYISNARMNVINAGSNKNVYSNEFQKLKNLVLEEVFSWSCNF